MNSLSGTISDRLRKLFTADQILHNPHPDRSSSPSAHTVSKQIKGRQLGKPDRRAKK